MEQWRRVCLRDKYKCVYCEKDMLTDFDTWQSIELDHLIPESKGGSSNDENLVTSCATCNRFKGAFFDEEATPEARLEQYRQLVAQKREEKACEYLQSVKEQKDGASI